MSEGLFLKQRRVVAVLSVVIIVLVLSAYYFYVWLPDIQSSKKGYQDVTVEQAKGLINTNPELMILDVRTYSEFDSGHIKDAICIPFDTLQQNLSKLNPQSKILVYCAKGARSSQAAKVLVNNGFQHIYNLLGGIEAWTQSGNPIDWCHCQPIEY